MAVAGDRVRAHVWISGRVQNVNFRAHTRDGAKRAGLDGWVKNLDDGRVEAVFEGPHAAVQRLVRWCYSGPPAAEVDHDHVAWEGATNRERPFSIVW
jgi:acylphosphatase